MGTEKNLRLGVLFVDTIVLLLFVLGFYHIMYHALPSSVIGITGRSWMIFVYLTSFLMSSLLFPSMVQLRLIKWSDVFVRVFTTCAMMLLFISLIMLLARPDHHFPRTFIFTSIAAYFVVLMSERSLLRIILTHARANKRNLKKVVLIGNDETVFQLYRILSTPIYGYDIVAMFYDGECANEEIRKKRMGGTNNVYGWLANNRDINEIYAYFPKEQHETINMMSKYCDNHLIRFYYLPAIDVFKGKITFTLLDDIPIIARREEPLRQTKNKIVKRIFDLIFSTIVLILVFPWVFIWVAIMIKIQSPGPIFFLQDRTGQDGKIFKCIKFRSMKVNKDSDTTQATKDDPRKFPFGNFMRKANIDELPQFINVFKGEMSVVGPRPHMLKHTEEYSRLINRFMVRHFAKPGITGLAQVTGFRGETRYIDQMEGRVKKDIEYIENWTFWLDLKIIIKTVTNMLGKEEGNAY